MVPEKIAFLFVLAFFLIVFIQSSLDKIFDYKGNLNFLIDLLKIHFSPPLIVFALISVTILEFISGILCLIGIIEFIFNDSSCCKIKLLSQLLRFSGVLTSSSAEGSETPSGAKLFVSICALIQSCTFLSR